MFRATAPAEGEAVRRTRMRRVTGRASLPPDRNGAGIVISYETFGEPTAIPLLLIQGLATQMLLWEEGFCEELVAQVCTSVLNCAPSAANLTR